MMDNITVFQTNCLPLQHRNFKNIMIVTIQQMEALYNEWNEKAFDGKLPNNVSFKLSKAKSWFGLFLVKLGKPTIKMSTTHDMNENGIRDVMVHEMIHLYCWKFEPRSQWHHGDVFKSKMNEINRKFGTHVVAKGLYENFERISANPTKLTERLVCAVYSKRLGNGFAVVTPSFRFKFNKAMETWSDIDYIRYYMTTDPYFEHMRKRVSTCGYQCVKSDVFTQKIKDLEGCEVKNFLFLLV